ncbi:MAG: radical SAM protein [Prevotella sp.]|nr:radical SAM protein [Prevotella sp.]
MKVNEIFYSLQGEGRWTGTAAVFLRLSGCNMKCWFCDTKHEEGTEMTEEEIVGRVKGYPARHIVITGGEPTMQLTARLTELLHREGFYIQIETNGTLPLREGADIDWITCSPKAGEIKLQRIDELKLLFVPEYIEKYKDVEASHFCIQPLDDHNGNDNVNKVVDYILEHPKWHLSLQTHKLINIQ